MFILFQSTRKKSCPRTIALAQRSVSRDTIETSSSRSSPLSDFNSRTRDLPARECTLVSLSQDSVIIPCALTSPPRQSLRSRGERRDAAIPSLDGKVIIYEPDLLGGAPAYSHGNRCRYCIHYVAVWITRGPRFADGHCGEFVLFKCSIFGTTRGSIIRLIIARMLSFRRSCVPDFVRVCARQNMQRPVSYAWWSLTSSL